MATTNGQLVSQIKCYWELTKPRITLLCLVMTAGGIALAPGRLSFLALLGCLLGTTMSVGSANALNMYIEREGDKFMRRTKVRPLPSGRLSPSQALWFGILLGLLSIAILLVTVNTLTAVLSTFALLSYVFIYTPLKRKTPLALLIGAVPGAIPPLLGWTAVTNNLDSPGLVLFSILLVWQIPHFIAIAIYHKKDYESAGIKTVPSVRGDFNAKIQAFAYSLVLIPVSLLLVPLEVASWIYGAVALALGLWFAGYSVIGLQSSAPPTWARKFFLVSLVYLPVLTLGLILDQVFL